MGTGHNTLQQGEPRQAAGHLPVHKVHIWKLAQQPHVRAGIRTGLLVGDEGSLDGASGTLPKGKIEIVLRKSDQFESLVAGGAATQRTQRTVRPGGEGPEEALPSS